MNLLELQLQDLSKAVMIALNKVGFEQIKSDDFFGTRKKIAEEMRKAA
jgi:hypothetical protein